MMVHHRHHDPPPRPDRSLNTITAKPTYYAGYDFKSRLEARWALLLDLLRIKWNYEPQNFTVTDGGYCPDFRLPTLHRWLEIKGAEPSPSAIAAARCVVGQFEEPIAVVWGALRDHAYPSEPGAFGTLVITPRGATHKDLAIRYYLQHFDKRSFSMHADFAHSHRFD